MPSSYTPSLKLILQATGENNGSWGTLTNDQLTSLVDIAVAGYTSLAMTSADFTLTSGNGSAANTSRYMFLNMTGTILAARNVICPSVSKLYFIKNSTTGGFAITLKTSAGTGIAIPSGKSMVLMCDGTNVIEAANYSSTSVSSVTGTAPVVSSGGATPAISMAAATASVDGYMTSVFATKLNGIGAGATVTGVTGTAPVVSSGGAAPVISMAAATASVNGYMTSAYATRLDGAIPGTTNFGYLNIPQDSQSVAYTLVLTDAGKHILHPSADANPRVYTIPANSAVAFPIGTAVTFVNQNAAGVITIAITTDTMRLAGTGTLGSRTLAANGTATALKITATEWFISGVNLT